MLVVLKEDSVRDGVVTYKLNINGPGRDRLSAEQ